MLGTHRWKLLAGVLLFLVGLIPLAGFGAAPGNTSGYAVRQPVIVVLNETVGNPGSVARELSAPLSAEARFVFDQALKGFAVEVPAQAIAAISRDPRVNYVEYDQEVTVFSDVPTGVDRIEADKSSATGIGSGQNLDADIAIIDTGIDHEHEALNVVGGTDCTQGNPFFVNCEDGRPGDGNGHGTHVAGIAAGIENSGSVGVAPGANLWAVKVLGDDGGGYVSQIIAAIDWITDRADTIEVANMSIGCECESNALDQAISNSIDAGVVYTVAAGNSASDTADFSPASHSEVISVSAMADFDGMAGGAADPTCRDDVGDDDTFTTFSNFGEEVDIAAPGVCIESAEAGGGYVELSGTSMAAPHVAGAAAVYIAENGIARSSNRWESVLNGIIGEWSVSQMDECGFTGGISGEPFLLFEECDGASGVDDEGDTELIVTVETDEASGIGETSAILNGELTALENAESATVYFEWRDAGAGTWTETSSQTLGGPDTFSEELAGLESDAQYEFRAVAEVADASDIGDTVTFTTTAEEGDEATSQPAIEWFNVSTRATGPWNRADVG